MKPRWLLSQASLAALVLTAACGGDSTKSPPVTEGAGSPTAVAAATATATTPVSSPAPAPAGQLGNIKVERVPVRWAPGPAPLDFANATEPADPWVNERAEAARREPSAPPAGQWAVYVAQGNAEPRELTTSKRWLDSLTWDKDGLRAGFLTRRSVPSSALGRPYEFSWRGYVNIDAPSGRATTTFEPFPMTFSAVVRDAGKTVSVEADAAKVSAVVAIGTASVLPPQPGVQQVRPVLESFHLLDAKGNARKLEGVAPLPAQGLLQWVPNGKTVVARGAESFFIPAVDGDALKVTGVLGLSIEYRVTGEGQKVEGSRVVFAVTSWVPGEAEFGIYDSISHSIRSIGSHPASGMPVMTWPTGFANKVSTQQRLIDLNSGQSEPLPPSNVLYPPSASYNPTSPNGRYVVRLPEIKFENYRSVPECQGLPYKIDIEDKQTGATRTVTECAGGTMASARWLGDDRLLVRVSPCAGGCDANESRNLIIEVATGGISPLSDSFEPNSFTSVSPDGSKVMAGGRQLRVYSSAGVQLRRQDAPAGYDVVAGAWSPDGASFAFILGARNLALGP
ncbi:MAG TPA: hypothetical protein VJB57_10365 [Dehalococcoidia bacterium]|nr:hypothetical protein [Dehalococcoidia bacterium]